MRTVLAALLMSLAACATREVVPSPARTQATPAMPSAPLDRAAPVSRIAFGSCNKQNDPQEHWATIAGTDPDLFVYLGDNVYGDVASDDPTLPELREAYATLAADTEFAAFRDDVPVMPVWDDHDYGRNDAGADFPLRAQSQDLFEEVWALPPNDPRRSREGVYHAVAVGAPGERVQIILLDTRYHRSALTPTDERGAPGKERYVPSDDPQQTMLGDEQMMWLQGVLTEPADLRVVVSSVQVLADGHGWEAWATMPLARAELYDVLAQAQRDNGARILLVSGDRHRGGFYEQETNGETLTEMTASSLNDPVAGAVEEAGPNRLGPTVIDANFGLLDIDWDAREATFSLRGIDGDTYERVSRPF